MQTSVGPAPPTLIYPETVERETVEVQNPGPAILAVSKRSGVAAGADLQVAANATEQVELLEGESLYGVLPGASAPQAVSVE